MTSQSLPAGLAWWGWLPSLDWKLDGGEIIITVCCTLFEFEAQIELLFNYIHLFIKENVKVKV